MAFIGGYSAAARAWIDWMSSNGQIGRRMRV
jgi:hypothetical protein